MWINTKEGELLNLAHCFLLRVQDGFNIGEPADTHELVALRQAFHQPEEFILYIGTHNECCARQDAIRNQLNEPSS